MPILPGRFIGFVGSEGEIHIKDNNDWAACPGLHLPSLRCDILKQPTGDDNTEAGCTVADVGNILISNVLQHLGPYNGVLMGLCGLA